MTKRNGIVALVVLLVLGSAVLLLSRGSSTSSTQTSSQTPILTQTITPTVSPTTNASQSAQITASPSAMQAMSKNVVEVTANGFSPVTITIKKGDLVTFKNTISPPSWPATALHPSHNVYPGSSITKCGTSEEKTIFDACRGIAQGKEWSFTFNNVGA